ncbi:MAG: hypothetical protein IJ642_10360 [Oscillospiraceae bacterium]|nr:hypothetical protein [Oscillospiraceae bacterium]
MGTVSKRTEKKRKEAFAVGIVALIVLTIICYVIGCVISQSDSFYLKTGINMNLKVYGVRYFIQILSILAPVIMYSVAYHGYADRSETEYSFVKTDGGKPYVYSGWTVKAVIAGVLAAVLAFVIYLIAFGGTMVLIKPLLLWIWLLQAVLSVVVFFIPQCKPLV